MTKIRYAKSVLAPTGFHKSDFHHHRLIVFHLNVMPLAVMLVALMWELMMQELQRLWHGKVVQQKAYSCITSVVRFEEVCRFPIAKQFPTIFLHQAIFLMHNFFSDRNRLVLEGEHNFDAKWVSELQSNGSLVTFYLSSSCFPLHRLKALLHVVLNCCSSWHCLICDVIWSLNLFSRSPGCICVCIISQKSWILSPIA